MANALVCQVSLASSTNMLVTNSPVRSLADVCEKQFGFVSEHQMVSEVGIYFALAAVFPSRKVCSRIVSYLIFLFCCIFSCA